MKQTVFYRMAGLLALMVLVTPLAQASAGTGRARKGITGDWLLKGDFDGRQITSILTLSRDKEGELAGQWISFFGVGELKDVKYKENKLSFVQVYRFGDNEYRSEFAGTIKRGKLSGILSSQWGEFQLEGQRIRPMPAVVGNWEMKIKVGEREFTATLVIKADKERKLTAEWQSEWGEHEITDVQFKARKLTFKRKSKVQDREWQSTFEGTVKGHALSGTIKSERGDIAAEGKRIGAALVGKWDIEMTSQRGTRRQILKVNPDLSGMYGPTAIEKVELEGDQVTWQIVLEFGEQKYEMNFEGKLDDKKLTGELTTSRGTRKVTGKKVTTAPKKR